MKKLILLFSIVLLTSCGPAEIKYQQVTIEYELLNGSIKTEYWDLPRGAGIYIHSDRGTYTLKAKGCSRNPFGFVIAHCTLQQGVIHFNIINRKNID